MVTAAGYGTRLGSAAPKALVEVAGQPLLAWALQHIAPLVDTIVVTAPPTHIAEIRDATTAALEAFPHITVHTVPGGDTRQASVAAALHVLDGEADAEPSIVLIHDAARAFMPTATMQGAIDAVRQGADGAVPVVPVVDTLVTAPAADGRLGSNVDRDSLRAVQTPQVFDGAAIRDAHRRTAGDTSLAATDDATLAAHCGYTVVAVDGHSWGFKVTHAADLDWAEHVARRSGQENAP